LEGVFGDRIISRGFWAARSPDLTGYDFYLWGNFKDKLYRTNPHTEEELKENTRKEIWKFLSKSFGRISTYLNGFESVCVYRDSIFSTS
jgi:hypothetical protein